MPKGITSLTGFVRKIEQIKKGHRGYLYFRGHGDSEYQIQPSVFRNKNLLRNEAKLLDHFQSELPDQFSSDKSTIDRLVRIQHYGVPTRLLDFTLNPLMALYFACKDDPKKRGQVIIMSFPSESVKFSGSDTVSCLANLSYLRIV